MALLEKALPPLAAGRNALMSSSNVLDLGIRLYIAKVFFLSGLTKIRDWETTVTLFREEYHVPVLPPELAAFMGGTGELVLLHGPGKLSLDAIVWKRMKQGRGQSAQCSVVSTEH